MSATNGNPFSAPGPALGYLFPVRLALLSLIRRAVSGGEDLEVSLETLDDVEFRENGSTVELLQSKYKLVRQADLTNSSPDLWKTIRVWSQAIRKGTVDINSVVLTLLTSSTAATGSIAAMLRNTGERNEHKALELLEGIASSSGNVALKSAFAEFEDLTAEQRLALVHAVVVHDRGPTIAELSDLIGRAAWVHADSTRRVYMVEALEGWWLDRVVQQLDPHVPKDRISWAEVRLVLDDIARRHPPDALPNDLADAEPPVPFDPSTATDVFVVQLRHVDLSNNYILRAMQDHWRAGEQRSRWVGALKLLPDTLIRYDNQLVEEWSRCYMQHCDGVCDTTPEEDLRARGRKLFYELDGRVYSLSGFAEQYLTRGSFHILADRQEKPPRIGWHPHWEARVRAHLETGASP